MGAMTLATLTGSEKQIAWATKIRDGAIKNQEAHGGPEWGRTAAEDVAAVLPILARQSSASWWIENQWLMSAAAFDILRRLGEGRASSWAQMPLNRGKMREFVNA